ACVAACPVKINIPHMLIGLREMQHQETGVGDQASGVRKGTRRHGIRWERLIYWASKEVLRRPWLYRLSLRLARWFLRPKAKDGWLSKLPGPGSGWTAARDFPA